MYCHLHLIKFISNNGGMTKMIYGENLNNIEKNVLDKKFEIDDLEGNFKELEDLDDLWYFVRSCKGGWIAGSSK